MQQGVGVRIQIDINFDKQQINSYKTLHVKFYKEENINKMSKTQIKIISNTLSYIYLNNL